MVRFSLPFSRRPASEAGSQFPCTHDGLKLQVREKSDRNPSATTLFQSGYVESGGANEANVNTKSDSKAGTGGIYFRCGASPGKAT